MKKGAECLKKNMKSDWWQNFIVNLLVTIAFRAVPLPSASENK